VLGGEESASDRPADNAQKAPHNRAEILSTEQAASGNSAIFTPYVVLRDAAAERPFSKDKPQDTATLHAATDADVAPVSIDTGLASLALVLGLHRIAVDADQLRHDSGLAGFATRDDLLRIAKRTASQTAPAQEGRSATAAGVKARAVKANWEKLSRLPLPAILQAADGRFFVLGSIGADAALIQIPGEAAPSKLTREQLEFLWLAEGATKGEVILVTTRESVAGSSAKFDVSWFIPQLVRYRRLFGEILLVSLGINLLGLAAPLFFQNVVDKVLVNNTLSTLSVLFWGFVAVSIWEVAFTWLRTRLYTETTVKIDVELGAKLFQHLLHLPLSYFESRRVGDTVTRVRELETIREFLTNTGMTVFLEPLFAIVFLVAMYLYAPLLFWVVAATIPLYILVSVLITPSLRARLNEKFERGAANNALLVETVSGVQTLKASAVEPQMQARWERQLAGYVTSGLRVALLANSGQQLVQLINKLSMAALLYLGAKMVISQQLTVGELVAFNMFAGRVAQPVLRLAQLWQDFQQVRISIDRLGDVLNIPTEAGAGSRTALPQLKGAVRFEHVDFKYKADGPNILEDINLEIAPGEMIGICGTSGSGKSTLTKLLQRLYTPLKGRLFIDGVDIAQIDPAWLRRQIGVVLQENILFNRTVRENIALADPILPMQAVMAAAQLAGAHEFILGMAQGYDTQIEERGSNLSGGQRQRVAIARALVTSPRILIFDEATSALDAESEEIIQANLKMMAQGRTVIIIAHRLSAIRGCDRIIAIEKGRIVEEGNHEQLMKSGGRYAQLYTKQMGIRL
jgi:ATP-binding cassette, subfamily B, bacterial HlyB/CyaB